MAQAKNNSAESIIFGFLIVIALLSGGALGQERQNSEYKADRNLRGASGVNPSTLAMEFSLPFGFYPGRAGNSVPISLSYSSKVWNSKSLPTQSVEIAVNNGDILSQVTTVNQTLPMFSRRSISGWTSSLQVPAIIRGREFFNQHGEIHFLSGEIADGTVSLVSCSDPTAWRCESEIRVSASCPSGYEIYTFCECADDQGSTSGYRIDCTVHPAGNNGCGGSGQPPCPGPTQYPIMERRHVVPRIRVLMPDGSTKEFRLEDKSVDCLLAPQDCEAYQDGAYLSVDGSGMKLVVGDMTIGNARHIVLYLGNGSRFVFPDTLNVQTNSFYLKATEYRDANGNKTGIDPLTGKWTDTLGREFGDIIPNVLNYQSPTVGEREFTLPGMSSPYKLTWKQLRNRLCVAGTEPECADTILEDPGKELAYEGGDSCQSVVNNNPLSPALFSVNPIETITNAPPYRYVEKDRICSIMPPLRPDTGGPTSTPHKFNPVVMARVDLPNGQKYEFKYNEYGEITKILYPTGAVERFRYEHIPPIGATSDPTNRGVVERWLIADGVTQHWTYAANSSGDEITTTAPDGSVTVRKMAYQATFGAFGFDNPTNGFPIEERVYRTDGLLASRKLTKYTVAPPRGTAPDPRATRDPRPVGSILISFEDGKALAVKSETEYDENGNSDPSFFSHLNPKRTKSYQFVSVPLSTAQSETLTFEQLDALFANVPLASVSENDYAYDANYKDRGITSLLTESRVLNPLTFDPQSTTNEVLAKTETIYDNTFPASNPNYPYSTETYGISGTFQCPSGSQTVACWQSPSSAYLGRPTTVRLWDSDNNIWHESHTRYDIFGNAVKVKDPAGNEVETFFENTAEKPYLYAYPTKVITPAPDPTGVHGTNQGSQATTTYDFNTGLPLSVTNDLGQTTKTEYNDPLLRPTRVYPVGFTAPESQTIYDDVNRTVKVRKQIDETHWDEATTFLDTLGRAVKTQATDSQGDIFVETEYDLLGRVSRTSNPYRQGDDIFWSRPRYDELSRVVETCAPSENPGSGNAPCPTGTSTGTVSFSFSTVQNAVGTVVTSTDASGRKSRSITNALGQLVRVDEPTGISSDPNADLGAIGAPNQPTYYTYNVQGKLVKVQQGKPGETTPIQYRYFKYDSLGRLIRVMQPEQEPNPNLALADPYNTSGQWSAAFKYNALGDLVRATDANGVSIINEYDKAKRVTKRCYSKPNLDITVTTCAGLGEDVSDNTPTVENFYDGFLAASQPPTASPNFAKGKLTRVASSVSDTRYTGFDNLGRITESIQRTPFGNEAVENATPRVSKYAYNFAGALIEETYPSTRVVRYEYESDGDLSRIWGKKDANAPERTYANSFSYTPDGKIERLKLGNNRWEWAKFNERLQVTELNLGAGVADASLWKLTYHYGELNADGRTVDAAKNTGNIAMQTVSFAGLTEPFVQTYRYDSLYRITEARETNGPATNASQNWKETFSYDRFGNRTSFSKFTGTTQLALDNKTFPSIDPDTNRFNPNQGYLYDKNGNLISDAEGRSFVFNGENKQAQIIKDGKLVGEYDYNGEGQRVRKRTYDANGFLQDTTVFVYSAGKLVAEYTTAAPPTNPTTRYTATDMLGSPRVITDSQGNVISRRDFKPFGEEITDNTGERTPAAKYGAADNLRQKFTTYQRDEETGLDFAEARMYENRHGRFTAVDPLLVSGTMRNPQSFNRFLYVQNDPTNLLDPSGLTCEQVSRNGEDDRCIWVSNGQGLYESMWASRFTAGNDLFDAGYAIVENPESVEPFILRELNDNYENPLNTVDEEYQAMVGMKVKLGINGRLEARDEETVMDETGEATQNTFTNRLLYGTCNEGQGSCGEQLFNQDLLPDSVELNGGFLGASLGTKLTRNGTWFGQFGGDIVGSVANPSTIVKIAQNARVTPSVSLMFNKTLRLGRMQIQERDNVESGFTVGIGGGSLAGGQVLYVPSTGDVVVGAGLTTPGIWVGGGYAAPFKTRLFSW